MGTTATPRSSSASATVQVPGSIFHMKLLLLVLLLGALDVQSFSPHVPSFLRRISFANDDHGGDKSSAFKVQSLQPIGSEAGMVCPHPPNVPPPLKLLFQHTEGATAIGSIPFFLKTQESMGSLMNIDNIVKHHVEASEPRSLEENPWFEFTVAMLEEELESRGLQVTGTKLELVAKLIESDAEMELYEREKMQRAAAGFVSAVIQNFWNKEFIRAVDRKTITGAAASAAIFALASGGNTVFAGVAGIATAYMAISPGAVGNAVRWFGMKVAQTVTAALHIVRIVYSDSAPVDETPETC